jgi:hypothetical protein
MLPYHLEGLVLAQGPEHGLHLGVARGLNYDSDQKVVKAQEICSDECSWEEMQLTRLQRWG